MPLIIGLVLALAGAGGGFWVTFSGLADSLIGGGSVAGAPVAEAGDGAAPAAAAGGQSAAAGGVAGYVPVGPLTVNLGPRGESRHLRFTAQLEVPPAQNAEVTRLMPRILDVINIYLRALDPQELEEPASLLRLRAQMLRRVQIVTGPGMVNDLLVIEFVFN